MAQLAGVSRVLGAPLTRSGGTSRVNQAPPPDPGAATSITRSPQNTPYFRRDAVDVTVTTTGAPAYPTGSGFVSTPGSTVYYLFAASVDSTFNSTPSGFTQVGTTGSGGGFNEVRLWKRVADGTESGTVTVTTSAGTDGSAFIVAYENPDSSVVRDKDVLWVYDSVADSLTITGTSASTTTTTDLDRIVVFSFGRATGGMSGGTTGVNITATGMTLGGTGVGNRVNSIAGGTNNLVAECLDRPVIAGGTGTIDPTIITATTSGFSTGVFCVLIASSEPVASSTTNDTATATAAGVATATATQIAPATSTAASTATGLARQIAGATATAASTATAAGTVIIPGTATATAASTATATGSVVVLGTATATAASTATANATIRATATATAAGTATAAAVQAATATASGAGTATASARLGAGATATAASTATNSNVVLIAPATATAASTATATAGGNATGTATATAASTATAVATVIAGATATAASTATAFVTLRGSATATAVSVATNSSVILRAPATATAAATVTAVGGLAGVTVTGTAVAQAVSTATATGSLPTSFLVSLVEDVDMTRLWHINRGYTAWRIGGVWHLGHSPDDSQLAGADLVLRGGYNNVVDAATGLELAAVGVTVDPIFG